MREYLNICVLMYINNKLKRRTSSFCKKRTSYHKSMYFFVSVAIIQLGFLAIKRCFIFVNNALAYNKPNKEKLSFLHW